MQVNQNEKAKLMKFIYEVDFALDDCVLYLDTHPFDKQALEYYENYKKMKKQAVAEYTRLYGPLTSDDVNVCNYWAWVKNPWPWEGGC